MGSSFHDHDPLHSGVEAIVVAKDPGAGERVAPCLALGEVRRVDALRHDAVVDEVLVDPLDRLALVDRDAPGRELQALHTTVALGFGAGVATDDAAVPEPEEPQPPASTAAASSAAVAARGTACEARVGS